jgi:hypothetical protein
VTELWTQPRTSPRPGARIVGAAEVSLKDHGVHESPTHREAAVPRALNEQWRELGMPGRRGKLLMTASSAGTALGDRPTLLGATCRALPLTYRILNAKIMPAGGSEYVPSLG